MSEIPRSWPAGRSALLTAEASAVARRLAEVIRESAAGVDGAEECADLLDDWAGVAAAAVDRAGDGAVRPVHALASRLGLGDAERDLVLLAGLPDEHECLAAVMRALNPRREPQLTVGLAAKVLGDRAVVNELLASGAAVRLGLVTLRQNGPFPEWSVGVGDGIWWALHGFDAWPVAVGRVHLPPPAPGLERWARRSEVVRAARALASRDTVIVTVDSKDLPVALSRCAALGSTAGTLLVAGRVDLGHPTAAAVVSMHALARDGVPVLVLMPGTTGTGQSLDLDSLPPGPTVVCVPAGTVTVSTARTVLALPLGPVDAHDRRAAWEAVLPGQPDLAPWLAARHPIDPAHTALVAEDLQGRHEPSARAVADAIRIRSELGLPAGADLVEPGASWRRLVLDKDSDEQLRDVVARIHNQATVLDDWGMLSAARAARGVRLIFTGPPGTGKSLAAEVLARALDTALLVVDVSRIVSKWIGETEKNLARIFDAAEASQCVLLLDEADAIFGRRTAISDARDRYANIETAYLLQRIDQFSGLVVLTTNLLQNIDPAFLRRVDFLIDFRVPDTASRERLWAIHLPEILRDVSVDLHVLAMTYPVPGAWIRGASISAAYAAARHETRITQEQLVTAMRREYDKAHKPCPERPTRRPGIPDARAIQTLLGTAAGSATKEAT
jgi:ATPase family associated with various cellular activities (AAA)